MAKCVSAIVKRFGMPVSTVRRVRVRKFGVNVLMPSTVTCRVTKAVHTGESLDVHYTATDARGNLVIHGGLVVFEGVPGSRM